MEIGFVLNGRKVTAEITASTVLLDVVRDKGC